MKPTVLTTLLYLVAGGVLVQAMLAGAFVSGVSDLRLAHLMVGWLLPYVALVPAGVAVARRRSAGLSVALTAGCVALPVVLWVQEALGHVSVPATTAVHVPLGVALFGGSLTLAILSHRHHPQGGER